MVYRLSFSGSAREDVIAKRSLKQHVGVERTIYEDILPDLPVSSLRYYGSTEDDDPDYFWLFIEDADGRAYTPRLKAHRVAAGRYLGTLHTSSACHQMLVKLPDRGPGHYLGRLRFARQWVERTLNLELVTEELESLQTILSNLERLEGRWNQLLEFCESLPRTLVHGDFSDHNIRIRATVPHATLVSFDWAEAGRGVPPVDIMGRFSHRGSHSVEPDIHTYWLVARKVWSLPKIQTIRKFETVGKTFRAVSAIAWDIPESDLTKSDSTLGYIEPWRIYSSWLDECLKDIKRLAREFSSLTER